MVDSVFVRRLRCQAMDGPSSSFATREEFWRLQSTIDALSATQQQHAERIMRIEKKGEDGVKSKSLWGPSSPFPSGLSSSHSHAGKKENDNSHKSG